MTKYTKEWEDTVAKAPKERCSMCGLPILHLFSKENESAKINCPRCKDEQDRQYLINEWDDCAWDW